MRDAQHVAHWLADMIELQRAAHRLARNIEARKRADPSAVDVAELGPLTLKTSGLADTLLVEEYKKTMYRAIWPLGAELPP